MSQLEQIINDAFENRADISPASVSAEVRAAVEDAINLLDSGKARVAEKTSGEWVVNQWLKKSRIAVVQNQREPRYRRRQQPLLRQG